MQCVGSINQDAVDDGEHGAGRNLLNYLKKNNLYNTAIFVVRYFGGAKIGPLRYQIIIDVAKDAHHQMVNKSFAEIEDQGIEPEPTAIERAAEPEPTVSEIAAV